MRAVPTSVGVFFGQVDKRPKGWYWTDAKSEKSKQAIRGPFETKEQAVDDALHSLASDKAGERGAASVSRTVTAGESLRSNPYWTLN